MIEILAKFIDEHPAVLEAMNNPLLSIIVLNFYIIGLRLYALDEMDKSFFVGFKSIIFKKAVL